NGRENKMKTLTELFNSPATLDLGWALLHFLWQGALLAGLCGFTWHLLRRHSARSRYVVGCCFLLALASAPVITYSVRSSRTPWLSQTWESSAGTGVAAISLEQHAAADRNPSSWRPTPRTNRLPANAWPSQAVLSGLVGFWFVGVFLLSSRLFLGW